MLSSLISNLIWGSSEPEPAEENGGAGDTEIEHSASEEAGDWLLITCQGRKSSSECSSRVNSVSDIESICSDGSWVIAPAPTFRESPSQSCEVFNPLEDLLIEHPTMSVYHQHSDRTDSNINEQLDNDVQNPPGGAENAVRNRELVLLQNRQRQQVAMHLHLPATVNTRRSARTLPPSKPPHLTRKALRRHNGSGARGKTGKKQVYRVPKCYLKAGKRRC